LEVTDPDAALLELAAELRAEESVISDHVVDPEDGPALGLLAAAGPAAAADPGAYAMIVESVREGYLLHYGTPRLLAPPEEDLALLAGDYLYAKGLERLAALGDLAAVRELSDLISLSAQLQAAEPGKAEAAAGRLWLGSVVAIACGSTAAHEAAKDELRRSGDAQALHAPTARTAAEAGLDRQLIEAAEAVGFPRFHLG
jgi:hypothetical protein